MAASDSFKEALKAGDITKALKLALSEVIELKITTWVASDDGAGSEAESSSNAQPGHRMQTRINIVDGDIDNEVGSLFLNRGPYSELQEFHLRQAQEGREIIHQNLSNIQQVVNLWAKATNKDSDAFAREETAPGTTQAADAVVDITEEDITHGSVTTPAIDNLTSLSPDNVQPTSDDGLSVIIEDIPEPLEADMEDLLAEADSPIESLEEETETPFMVEDLAEDAVEEDLEAGSGDELGMAELDELAEASQPETIGEEALEEAFDEAFDIDNFSDAEEPGEPDESLDLGLDNGLQSLPEEELAEAPSEVEAFPDFADDPADNGSGEEAWGETPTELSDVADVGEDEIFGDTANQGSDESDESDESESQVDFDFDRIEVLSNNGGVDDPLGLADSDLDLPTDNGIGSDPMSTFEADPLANAWEDPDDSDLSNAMAGIDDIDLEADEPSLEEDASWENALYSDNGSTDALSDLDGEDTEASGPVEELDLDLDVADGDAANGSEQPSLSPLDALFNQEESSDDWSAEYSSQKKNDPLATLFGETPPDSLREFLSEADTAIADESLLDDEEANPFADFPDSQTTANNADESDRWAEFDDEEDNSLPEFAPPPSDRQ